MQAPSAKTDSLPSRRRDPSPPPGLEKAPSTGSAHVEANEKGVKPLSTLSNPSDETLTTDSGVEAAFEAKVRLINAALAEIGHGKFQWFLFGATGMGWTVDNIWLQGIALLLPAIQNEFRPSRVTMSTLFLYVGLILGAFLWGISADIVGRRFAWNATLVVSGVFGIIAGASVNFTMWCAMVTMIGFGVGGNLPVDGAMFLEFLPQQKQWLLTLLSVWWAVGQVIASLIIWPLVVNFSCPEVPDISDPTRTMCELGTNGQNMSWRYGMYTLGGFVLLCWIVRIFIFPFPESPKWLASQGRDDEAIDTIAFVANFNGKPMPKITAVDLKNIAAKYGVESHAKLPTKVIMKRSLAEFSWKMVKPLFAHRKLAINTSLIILIYAIIGLAYPLFNSFLPLYLTQIPGETTDGAYRNYIIQAACGVPGSIIAAALVEWKVRGKWSFVAGRKGALAWCTILSGVFLFLFTTASTSNAVLGWNCATSLTQNAMYGILYGYAPEVFPTPVRGTGDALAATANRTFGLLAPIIKMYGSANNDVPVFVAAALFLVAGVLAFGLPVETAGVDAL